MLFSLALAMAAPSTEEAAALFSAWSTVANRPQTQVVPPPRGGADLLKGYQKDNLFILQDPDGQWFTEATTHAFQGDVNWVTSSITQAFYRDNPDNYDYVCILLLKDLKLFFAFYQPIANDVKGIGYDSVTKNEVFDTDSGNSLDGLIFMNYEGLWSGNRASGRYVFGQEFMHRWGAFTNIQVEGLAEDDLLGRDTSHWSYWLDTPNSPMEGNHWLDNGDGTWSTDTRGTSGYSELDLYLMGFVGPEAVPTQTYLQVSAEEQARVGMDKTSAPSYFLCTSGNGGCAKTTVTATPLQFGVDAIIAAEGERVPSVADSPKNFKMAFIVVALQGDDVDGSLERVDGVRQAFETDWEEDVHNLADLDTTLNGSTAPEWGTVTDTGDTGGDTAVDTADTGTADEDTDTPKKETPSGCGCTSSPEAPSGLLLGLLAAIGLRRRRS